MKDRGVVTRSCENLVVGTFANPNKEQHGQRSKSNTRELPRAY
jgi:hypothetical protein